jgi:hypothetical protein
MRNALGPVRPRTKVSTTICTGHKTPENGRMEKINQVFLKRKVFGLPLKSGKLWKVRAKAKIYGLGKAILIQTQTGYVSVLEAASTYSSVSA